MIRLFYNDAGEITQQYTNAKYAPTDGTFIDLDIEKIKINEYTINVATKELVHGGEQEIKSLVQLRREAVKPPPTYQKQRKDAYGSIPAQLDTLWHDINDGKFGENAKTSTWFTDISTVKSEIPKT